MSSSTRPLIVAEIAQAHDGSLGLLYSLIDASKKAGADAVKFQFHCAEEESLPFDKWRIPFSYEDKSRFDYWKRMQFSEEIWRDIRKYCDKIDIKFIASPFSESRLSFLSTLNPSSIKVASPDIYNPFIISNPLLYQFPLVISTGMSLISDVDSILAKYLPNHSDLTLLHCVSEYPCQPEDWCLSRIAELSSLGCSPKVGLSDQRYNLSIYLCYGVQSTYD